MVSSDESALELFQEWSGRAMPNDTKWSYHDHLSSTLTNLFEISRMTSFFFEMEICTANNL